MKYFLIIFYLLTVVPFATQSQSLQSPRLLRVSVSDSGGAALPGLALLVYRSGKDTLLYKVALTDSLGRAAIPVNEPGRYLFRSGSGNQGYSTPLLIDSVFDFSVMHPVRLPVAQVVKDIMGVTVVARKPLVEQQVDMLVFNAGSSLLASTGTALDVLKRAPLVNVDSRQQISIAGVPGITVFLDGRQLYATGDELAALLKSIPASDVETIEIVNTPSASNDAAGGGGILRIKTKRSSRQGISGTIGGDYEQHRYASFNLRSNINVNAGKVNFFFTYSHMRPRGFIFSHAERRYTEPGNESLFDNREEQVNRRRNHYLNTGLDYYISKHHIIGVLANMFLVDDRRETNGYTMLRDVNPARNSNNIATLNSKTDFLYRLFNINYSGKLDGKSKLLKVRLEHAITDNELEQYLDTRYFDAAGASLRPPFMQRTINPSTVTISGVSADYEQPAGKRMKIETGFKVTRSDTRNDNNTDSLQLNNWVKVPSLSDGYGFLETISALYLSSTYSGKKADIKAGLRAEHTDNTVTFTRNGIAPLKRNYLNVFPSVSLLHKINPKNRIVYSYSMRIDRPGYRLLNPFRIYADPFTYRTGNPAIKPVYTHTFRVGYTLKQKYIFSLSMSGSRGVFTEIVRFDKLTRETVYSYENLNSRYSVSGNIYMPFSYKKWYQSSISITPGYYSLRPGTGSIDNLRQDIWGISINNSNTLQLPKQFRADVDLYYNSPRLSGIYEYQSRFNLGVAVGKTIAKGKLRMRIAVNDILYTDISRYKVFPVNQAFIYRNIYNSRSVNFSLSYSFKSGKLQRDRYRETGISEEQNRANN